MVTSALFEIENCGDIPQAARLVSDTVLAGGVVLYPSDTVYGLMCRADSREAVDRIHRIKGYSKRRPFILLVDGTDMAETLARCSDPEIRAIMKSSWPGKLTLLLPIRDRCPEWVASDDGFIALRHPKHRLSELILERCDMPLVSTSANLSGGGYNTDYDEIPKGIRNSVDLTVYSGILPPSSPSTIIRLVRGRG